MFEATTSRASVQTRLLKELLGLFGGNARPVMAHLVEMGKISREDIEDAQKLLDAHRAKARPEANRDDARADRPPVAIDAVLRGDLVDHLALRDNSAAVRHWLWLLASVKFLVPFSVLHLLGAAAGLPTPSSPSQFRGDRVAAATPMVAPAA